MVLFYDAVLPLAADTPHPGACSTRGCGAARPAGPNFRVLPHSRSPRLAACGNDSLSLRRTSWCGTPLLLFSFATPLLAGAQSTDPDFGGARARLEAHVGVGMLDGSASALAGGAASVGLGDRFWIGGAGYVLNEVSMDDPQHGATGVGMGFGGVVVEVDLLEQGVGTWSAGLLVGGGNADARDVVVGVEIGSDNFVVFQPSIRFRAPWRGPAGIGASIAYRRAFGVQDIATLDAGNVSGLLGTLFISLTRN